MKQVWLKLGAETRGPYQVHGPVVIVKDDSWNLDELQRLGFTVEPFEEPRREFWIAPRKQEASGYVGDHYRAFESGNGWNCDPIHTVELRPGERIVSRKEVVDAVDEALRIPGSQLVLNILKALGLGEP